MEAQQQSFSCPKCGSGTCKLGEFHAAGGFWSKMFDVQGTKFSTVTCEQCGFTEIYKKAGRKGGNIIDLLTG